MATTYKNLILWQKSFVLALEVYRLSSLFPKSELYGLTSQLRRAVVSIVSNIAEGFSRKTKGDRLRFCSIAFASSSEVETQLLLAKELGFAPSEAFKRVEVLLEEVRKILNHYLAKERGIAGSF